VVEALAAEENIRIRSRESGARVGRGTIRRQPVLLALPQTYMNASGEAVSALCQQNGIDPPDVCIVFDEVDLPLGTLRIRPRGSGGTHNGMRSVVARVGTEIPRLRVGVRGARYSRERDLADYVLEPFARSEREPFEESVARAGEVLRVWLSEGVDAAMRIANANTNTSSPGGDAGPD
jgi:PTH1 family peptidyl-tRNA hydrolase